MALKRVYSFDITGGPAVDRVVLSNAGKQDKILEPIGITNWQLAILCVVGQRDVITSSQIGSSLWMDRTTVAAAIKPLRANRAVEKRELSGRRGFGFALTDLGREMLAQGLYLWSDANSAVTCSNDNDFCAQSGEPETREPEPKKTA